MKTPLIILFLTIVLTSLSSYAIASDSPEVAACKRSVDADNPELDYGIATVLQFHELSRVSQDLNDLRIELLGGGSDFNRYEKWIAVDVERIDRTYSQSDGGRKINKYIQCLEKTINKKANKGSKK